MLKKFLEWIGVKEKIHQRSKEGPHFYKEGDIWWCAVGENVGIEINGKGKTFSRPVFVYKKLSREGFMGIPLSTQIKEGTWYVSITFQERKNCANLAQVRVFSASRMYGKFGELDEGDVKRIKDGFLRLYS